MMISGGCNPNAPIYGVSDDQQHLISSSVDATSSSQGTNPTSFLYNLSLLKDKIHQVESVATVFLSHDHHHPDQSTAFVIPTLGTLIQEIIVTASSMMFACQQMSLAPLPATNSGGAAAVESTFLYDRVDHWSYGDVYNCNSSNNNNNSTEGVRRNAPEKTETEEASENYDIVELKAADLVAKNTHFRHVYNCNSSNNNNSTEGVRRNAPEKTETEEASENYDIVELKAADLLAKYTHFCHVCGKGFKRDANLRMHMRAHGDEYKSSSALSRPTKNAEREGGERRKYSCPQEGCRWNMKHAKFQPLKSMICVKNHYKRSHCPKMYVCKRCSRKHFSVLSDLRTHEKHCGDIKWVCSCGTNFSRKDKLTGHVALFVGHTPAVNGR